MTWKHANRTLIKYQYEYTCIMNYLTLEEPFYIMYNDQYIRIVDYDTKHIHDSIPLND